MDNNNFYKINLIEKNTYRIFEPGQNFISLLIGEEKALLIDTGYGYGNLKETVESLTSLPIIVINTHGHLDHTGGNYFFDEIYINPKDIETYKKYQLEKEMMIIKQKERCDIAKKDYYWPKDFDKDSYLNTSTKKFLPLKNHEIIDLGNRKVEIIEVPGHTIGQLVLFDYETKILFSSDAVSNTLWLNTDNGISLEKYIEQLKELKKYPINYILTGHLEKKLPVQVIDALEETIKERNLAHSKTFIHPRNGSKALIFKKKVSELNGNFQIEGIENMYLVYALALAKKQ